MKIMQFPQFLFLYYVLHFLVNFSLTSYSHTIFEKGTVEGLPYRIGIVTYRVCGVNKKSINK